MFTLRKGLLLFVMIFSVATIFAGNSEDDGVIKYTSSYFPFDTTKVLHYKSSFGDAVSSTIKEGDHYRIQNDSDNFKYGQKFIINENGLFVCHTEQKLDMFFVVSAHKKISYPMPLLQIPFPLSENDKWTFDGIEIEGTDTTKVQITGRLVDEDGIDTEAGDFDCIEIELEIKSETGSKTIVNEWLAEGIGIVKIQVQAEGKGIMGLAMKMLGLNEIDFELTKIETKI